MDETEDKVFTSIKKIQVSHITVLNACVFLNQYYHFVCHCFSQLISH